MRRAGLAIPLLVITQLSSGPARADVKCYPDDSQTGAGSYPGSARRYQGPMPGMAERTGDRTGVPSGGRALPGNPNCYVVPHVTAENGVPCKRDRDCPDKRCRLFPDGDKYCVAERKACTLPGNDGVPGGVVIALHQQCYECAAGIGWKLCGEAAKQALQANQEGVAVREPADESGREDWREREPTADHYRSTGR